MSRTDLTASLNDPKRTNTDNYLREFKSARIQSRTQSMPVRRLGAGHDSGETEYRISNFGYPVSCAHAHAQTATLNLRGRH
jgi:hypothetical protein